MNSEQTPPDNGRPDNTEAGLTTRDESTNQPKRRRPTAKVKLNENLA